MTTPDKFETIETISGFPPCPECDTQLLFNNMPGEGESYWRCPICHTDYDTPDLIKALNQNAALAWAMGEDNGFHVLP